MRGGIPEVTPTIVAPATPPGRGAVAVVRLSGPKVPAIAERLLGRLSPARRATLVQVRDEAGEALDRGLALFFPAPHSYTGEDVLELHLHGSPVIVREVLRAAIACGARLAEPGEFTKRAFLNGKLGLHEAAAVADLIAAEGRAAARAALANLGGGLTAAVGALRDGLARVLEEVAGALDFPDEVPEPDRAALAARISAVAAGVERLLRDGERGRLVREGVTVAIVGPPNAGKSSLLNALLGEERAIVSEIPGTTRDTIEETITIDGVPVRLIDTAGIRAHADRLEAEGIARSRRALQHARVALLVIDGSVPLGAEARELVRESAERPRVVFCNKADLGQRGADELGDPDAIVGSVREPETLERLRRALAVAGWGGERIDLDHPHLAAAHEVEAAIRAREALAAAEAALAGGEALDLIGAELQRAYAALAHLDGSGAAEEIVTGIFARFCIGK